MRAFKTAKNHRTEFVRIVEEQRKKHEGVLVLFREGDFYVIINEDAEEAAVVLGCPILTHRSSDDGIEKEIAFTHWALDINLPRLIRAGHRVAICDCVD